MRKILLLTLPFLLLVGCGNTDPQQLKERFIGGSTEERVIAVGIMNIDTTEDVIQNSYPGYLEEGQSVDLAFKYGGLLEQIYVKEGSRVTKGQRLAKASSPTLENSLRSAQATLEQAQDAYNRLKKVHDNGSLPDIKWKEMEANLEKAQAAYDLAYAMIAENDLTAPFSGTVSAVNVEVGENIPPLRPVVSLINTDKMSVKITVPENEIAAIHTGDPAKIVIPALNDRHYSGQVTEKGMTASLLTHSYPVKVLVDNPDKDLASGMIAKVMLKADVNSAIIIPANSILINKDGKFVWVVENERATRRVIQISGYSGTGVIVSEGLKGGDQVIVEGYQKVSEGMKVSGK